MARKNLYNLWVTVLLLSLATVASADITDKIAQLDIDRANLEDVIRIFGEPEKYVWGREIYTKDNLPKTFVICFPDDFNVFMSNNKVVELRHEGPGSGYVWRGKLKVGDSLELVTDVIGNPVQTIEGQENQFKDQVLYKDIEGREGHCYYARSDLDLRLWFADYKLFAIYMTRSDYGEDDEEDEKAVIPSTSIIDENGRIVDKIDYPFVNDPQVIGAWKSVDFVEEIEDFNPAIKSFGGELYLKEIIVLDNGRTEGPWSWTKGLLLHPNDKTASMYLIEELAGSRYMFFEWKSGDYVIRHSKPSFYVLKKVSLEEIQSDMIKRKQAVMPSTSTIDENGRIVDKIDYPFLNDPEIIGVWNSVDFVDTPDGFEPGDMQWKGGELYLKELFFLPDGQTPNSWQTWTKGLVLHSGDKTASAYLIKELDGSKYMFFEWKSGDYTIRGMKPKYYVLKKE